MINSNVTMEVGHHGHARAYTQLEPSSLVEKTRFTVSTHRVGARLASYVATSPISFKAKMGKATCRPFKK